MADNDDVRKQIEAKRQRLEELKARRANRAAAPAAASPRAAAPASAAPTSAANVLDQVNKLVGGSHTPKLTAALTQAMHNILPQERHQYDKECQTEIGVKLEGKAKDMEATLRAEQEALMLKEEKVKQLLDQLKLDKAKYDGLREEDRLREVEELSSEEANRVQNSVEFQNFFSQATRVMERALNMDSYDITVDYARDGDDVVSNKTVSSAQTFRDKRVAGRAVTSINWSPKYPELLIAAYAGQDDPMSFDPDGTVMVWNKHMPNRPEYVFTCNSAVLSAQFHPTNPKLIIGACQSGQIVIWDTREKTTPVNRTSLSHGHTHPVYALGTVSVVNKLHNIVSVSTDGHLCVWGDNNLHNPSKEVKLAHGKDEITTTSFSFPKNTNSVLMGSDEGFVYKAHINDNEGVYEAVQAHLAPVTNINFHPSPKNANVSDLYLTSSFDWTVKLWSDKVSARPLFTFESARDYVMDAQWSPVHPALFAMGDGGGKLDLWNINKDTEVPIFSATIDSTAAGGEPAAISRVSWSDEGSNIAAGTSTGVIHVFNLSDDTSQPSNEDGARFFEKVQRKMLSTN